MTSVVGARPSPNERMLPFAVALVVAAALGAWLVTGRAVAVPLVAVGTVSVVAAVVDARTCRIPNRLAVAGLGAVVAGVAGTALGDHRSWAELAEGALAGVLLSGAPFLGIVWLVRPAAIGAGDVKLLTVQGAAIGLLAPLAAVFVLLGGWLGAGGQMVVRGRRPTPLGPGMAIGFAAAVAIGAAANGSLGGIY